jgi:ribosomal protein S1
MDDLLSQSGGTFTTKYERGDKVEGTILEITPKSVTVDIGGKAEGLIAESAYQESRGFIKKLKVGDTIKAKIIVAETPEGYAILSLRDSSQGFVWDALSEAEKEGKALSVTVKNATKSGLVVDVMGVTGFIPSSYLGKKASKERDKLVGSSIKAVIIETDKNTKKVVLSEKHVSEKEDVAAEKFALDKIKVGEAYEGVIKTITDFGCFVAIPVVVGKDKETEFEGLVHVSEFSWDKVNKPSDIYSVGDKVKVKVISKDDRRILLSIKQTKKDPWEEIGEKYKPDQKLKGKIMKVSDFGVFVQLEPGIEGLIHITKVPPGVKLEVGKDVEVYIEDVDIKDKKISLGIVLMAKPVGYK